MTRSPAPVIAAIAHRGRSRHAGFTIAEVAMATFVMALGITTSIVALQTGFRHMDVARGNTIAAQMIQSEMERLRMMSWAGISTLQTNHPTETFDGATYFGSDAKNAGSYSITRTIADRAGHADMKDITVSVAWRGRQGRAYTRSFTMLYARNGLYDYYYTIAHP